MREYFILIAILGAIWLLLSAPLVVLFLAITVPFLDWRFFKQKLAQNHILFIVELLDIDRHHVNMIYGSGFLCLVLGIIKAIVDSSLGPVGTGLAISVAVNNNGTLRILRSITDWRELKRMPRHSYPLKA